MWARRLSRGKMRGVELELRTVSMYSPREVGLGAIFVVVSWN
jgi:hypothetical protein